LDAANAHTEQNLPVHWIRAYFEFFPLYRGVGRLNFWARKRYMKSLEQYLRESAVPIETIEMFIDPEQSCWAKFDPVVGYTLDNYMPRDGIDGSLTISTSQKNGMRTPHNYTERPCRINTYGNSYTQCHQVSDGETWQEYLSSHLGEPIRNFGMGGFGVYQAYRRMIQMEQSDIGAQYAILYIWGDDHFRSLMRCRHAVTYPWWNDQQGQMFHGNFWAHLEMDLDSKILVEKENPLATAESLYKMTEPDFMVDALKDDLILQLYIVNEVEPASLNLNSLYSLAEILDVEGIDVSSTERLKQTSSCLRDAYGFAATKFIVKKASDYCLRMEKKLMICLLDPTVTRQLLNNQPRYDQEIINFLEDERITFFDMNLIHQSDYRDFNLSVEDYMKRYYLSRSHYSHYNPAGNHFFAYSIKDKIVDWLDPKPVTYINDKSKIIDFKRYFPE
jgi:hypothetical protein